MGSRIINTNDYISREEMLELIEALTLDEMRQLGKIASYYGTWVNGWTAGDILNEALLRAIRYDNGPDKRRRCKKGNNILRFFASAMRSIVSSEGKKGVNSETHIPASTDGVEGTIDISDSRPIQDKQLINQNYISQIIALFGDDENAQIIVEGLGEGMRGKELKELTDLDETAYQSKRTLISRRLKKAFPQGFKGIML
tara:strand:+ start:3393 stop:3989 length:597 start_codon:yes stop_codon:yes gene_type:complete